MNLHFNKELLKEFIDNLSTRSGIDSDINESLFRGYRFNSKSSSRSIKY